MATVPHTTDQRRVLLRYNDGAITLHWLTVALVLTQLYVGFTFGSMVRGPVRDQWFTWHKSIGATILLLSLARLAWRFAHKPPPFPDDLPSWERLVAVWNHRVFYFLLIALPLTGLAAISAGQAGVTKLVGGVPLPLIPGVSETAAGTLGDVHVLLVFATIALVVLHVAAALKHQFLDRARVAGRMPPFRGPSGEPVQADKR